MFNEIDKDNETNEFQYSFDVPVVTNFNDTKIDDLKWFQNRFSGITEEINVELQFNETMVDITEIESKILDDQNERQLNEPMMPIIEYLEITDDICDKSKTGDHNERSKTLTEEICDDSLNSLGIGENKILENYSDRLELSTNNNSKETMARNEVLHNDNMEGVENVKEDLPLIIYTDNKENIKEKVIQKNGKVISSIFKQEVVKNQKFPFLSEQSENNIKLKMGPTKFEIERFYKPKPLAEAKDNNCVRNQIKSASMPPRIKRMPTIPLSPKLLTKTRAEQKLKRDGQGTEQLERHSTNATKGATLAKQSLKMQNKTKIGALWK